MTIALAALVLCSLSPQSLLSSTSLAQSKVQIIKGKKGTVKAANPAPATETSATVAPVAPADTGKAQALDRKSAELDAKSRDLAQREQAINEKESAAAESDKKKSEQLKKQQKHIEKVGEQNQEMLQQASDSLAGD